MINVKEKTKSKFLESFQTVVIWSIRVLEKQNQGVRFIERINSHDTRG